MVVRFNMLVRWKSRLLAKLIVLQLEKPQKHHQNIVYLNLTSRLTACLDS